MSEISELKEFDRTELIKKGLVKNGARICRYNVLDKYYQKGWLDFGNRKSAGAIDRYCMGIELFNTFEACRFPSAGAVDMEKIRVDGGGDFINIPDFVADARRKLGKYLNSLTPAFIPAVWTVCILNQEVSANDNEEVIIWTDKRGREHKKFKLEIKKSVRDGFIFSAKYDLNRGLDELDEKFNHCKRPDCGLKK